MKKLINILGAALIGIGINANAQKYFSKTENQKYYVSHAFADTDTDSIPDLIVASYDMNKNGIVDTYAVFLITRRDSSNCYTGDLANAVYEDKNEDGVPEKYFLDKDEDGILEESGNFEGELEKVIKV